ncbi:hypothetical protein CVT26_014161 [Gymnopilus dilepis]|uniref:Uncharacterized protein n=1 Tax=Gymnopilus dilepis TaxID=231916 RepID=A0A409VUH5_9AGAR|nr:hypothetical protein CVT26_014161 [Gymnopilus dilepis]
MDTPNPQAQSSASQQNKPRIQRKLQDLPGIANFIVVTVRPKRGRPRKNRRVSQPTRPRDIVAHPTRLDPATRSRSFSASADPQLIDHSSSGYDVAFGLQEYLHDSTVPMSQHPSPHLITQAAISDRRVGSPADYRQYMGVPLPVTSSYCAIPSSPAHDHTHALHNPNFVPFPGLPATDAQYPVYEADPVSINCSGDLLTRQPEDSFDLTSLPLHDEHLGATSIDPTASEPWISPDWTPENQDTSTGFNTTGILPSHPRPDLRYFLEHSSNIENTMVPAQEHGDPDVNFDVEDSSYSTVYHMCQTPSGNSNSQELYSNYNQQHEYVQDGRGPGPFTN